jgi:hypothetical protein
MKFCHSLSHFSIHSRFHLLISHIHIHSLILPHSHSLDDDDDDDDNDNNNNNNENRNEYEYDPEWDEQIFLTLNANNLPLLNDSSQNNLNQSDNISQSQTHSLNLKTNDIVVGDEYDPNDPQNQPLDFGVKHFLTYKDGTNPSINTLRKTNHHQVPTYNTH